MRQTIQARELAESETRAALPYTPPVVPPSVDKQPAAYPGMLVLWLDGDTYQTLGEDLETECGIEFIAVERPILSLGGQAYNHAI